MYKKVMSGEIESWATYFRSVSFERIGGAIIKSKSTKPVQNEFVDIFDEFGKTQNSSQTQSVTSSRVDILSTTNHQSIWSKLRNDEKFNDVCFVLKGDLIGANRAVLAANSDFFKTLLFGSFKESSEDVIKIEEYSFETFRKIVDFCYIGKIESVEITCLEELLRAGHQYQLKSLVEGVVGVVEKVVNSSNCFYWLEIASLLDLSRLEQQCLSSMRSWLMETRDAEYKVLNTVPGHRTFAQRYHADERIERWARLDSRYKSLLELKPETLVRTLKSSTVSINQELFLDYLLAQKEKWNLLKTLLDSKFFDFIKMPIAFLTKLLSHNLNARKNDVDFFDFSNVEREIVTGLEAGANRIAKCQNCRNNYS